MPKGKAKGKGKVKGGYLGMGGGKKLRPGEKMPTARTIKRKGSP